MGLLKQARENVAEKEGADAQDAWDEGRLGYVHRAESALSGRLPDKVLTPQLDAILRVGWKLHSSTMTFNQKGLNSEVVLFVFVR